MQEPKKILIIGLTERMGGVETFIYNTTKFSDRSKYEYEYLVHGADHCVFQKEIGAFYGDSLPIHFVRKIKGNPFGWLKDMLAFYKKNGKKYDWIHLQTGATSEIIYVFPFCLFYKIPVISHSHNGSGYNPFIHTLFRPILNGVTQKRIACSQAAAKWLFGRKADQALILPNGIDTDRFRFSFEKREKIRKQYGIGSELVIGHIGRFSPQKNHEKILEIFEEIKKRVPNAKLILVGVGERRDLILQKAQSLAFSKDILFVGKQEKTEDFYSAFDAFLMPSFYEGLPIVGIEAQASGLPCFFSHTIDNQILLTDRAYSLPLEDSYSDWADRILAVCSESDLVRERSSYAEKIEERGYSIKNTLRTLEQVYEV
jgi:hypothetical protein